MNEHAEFEETLSLPQALEVLSGLRGDAANEPKTVLVLAFRGWNDAGEAATGVLKRIRHELRGVEIHSMTEERYYDYQVARPTVSRTKGGERRLQWPGVRFYETTPAESGLRTILAYGHEPSFGWRAYADQFLAFVAQENVDAVLLVGALLADTPHSRALPAATTTESRALRKLMGVEQSAYEGPTGMLGVLSDKLHRHGVPNLSLWVSVPHYVSQAPSPKAELALISELEDIFGFVWTDPELVQQAAAWEKSVDELAAGDEDIRHYVEALERAIDEAVAEESAMPPVSGEVIATEIEQYLREYNEEKSADEED